MRRFLLQCLFFAGILNFFTFWFAAVYFGGDAVSGRAMDGHYFLSNHGHLHEVSLAVFTYSKWHTYSVFVTHPIAILCGWLLSRKASI
jgi:hypothetical protein